MSFVRGMIAIAALISPALLSAQAPNSAPTTDERRLTPEQIEAVLAEAAAKRAAAEKQVPVRETTADEDVPLPPQLHGELGISIGSGGYREIFGTGYYPLGENGAAAISLDFVDWGQRRFPDKK